MRRMTVLVLLAAAAVTGNTIGPPEWSIEKVDTGAAKSTTLRVDRDGNLHIAYIIDDGNRYPLRYAYWEKRLNKWFTMTVAEQAGFASMTLDSRQRPHIAFSDFGTASGSKLRYVHWDGREWLVEPLPLNSDVISYFTSIAMDRNDTPYISFYEYRGPKDSEIRIRLRNVRKVGKQWEVRTVDPAEGSGKFNCTVSDAQGNIHIGYANVAAITSGARYAIWKGKGWAGEEVDSTEQNRESVGYSACIAVDKDGDPHMSYANLARPSMRYAVRKNNRWQVSVIDAVVAVAYPDRNSIALDADNKPYVSYHDAGRGQLRVAHQESDQWVVEIVDSGGCGFNSSVQVDKDAIYVSYGDNGQSALKLARRPLGLGARR